MKLRYTQSSPFVRKVMIVALETGLADRIELVATDPWAPDTDLSHDNPLGKVPALITDDGDCLIDSPLICEYLDSQHSRAKLFPAAGRARWTALRRQALADGILDATVGFRIETARRPAAVRWSGWCDRLMGAVRRSLDRLEGEAAELSGQFTIGEITLACALGYLDFRNPDEDWRATRPGLAEWYAAQQTRPSVASTAPHD